MYHIHLVWRTFARDSHYLKRKQTCSGAREPPVTGQETADVDLRLTVSFVILKSREYKNLTLLLNNKTIWYPKPVFCWEHEEEVDVIGWRLCFWTETKVWQVLTCQRVRGVGFSRHALTFDLFSIALVRCVELRRNDEASCIVCVYLSNQV